MSVPNVPGEDARIVLLDEKSCLALRQVDAVARPYLACHSQSLALGQQLTVLSRVGANHTPTADAAEVGAMLAPTDNDVPGAVVQLNRGFPRVYAGAATLSTGGRLAGFLAIPLDGQQGVVVPAARVVELIDQAEQNLDEPGSEAGQSRSSAVAE